MKIEIDGRPIQKPQYAKKLSDSQYLEYLANAPYLKDHGWMGIWEGGSVGRFNISTLDRLAADPKLYSHIENVIGNGKSYRSKGLISELTRNLAENNELLELSCKDGLRFFDEGLVQDWRKRFVGDLDYNIPTLNPHLKKGLLVFHGNVGEVSSLNGGTLYIDGNVNRLTGCSRGIVYVNGDVNEIKDSEKAIFIVAGTVGKYVQHRHSSGGLQKEVTPSPFIFTTHELAVEIPDTYKTRDDQKPTLSPSFVVTKDQLADWIPEGTKDRAMHLCRQRLSQYLNDLREEVIRFSEPEQMADFAKYNIYGYVEGSSSGFYDGVHHASPASAYD